MTRLSIQTVLLVLFAMACGVAQEKPTPAEKSNPDPRALGVAAPDTLFKSAPRDNTARSTQALPKFDLPEYVITGVASIDLPDVEKQDGDEPQHVVELANPLDALRDRLTAEFLSGEKDGLPIVVGSESSGRIRASSGTYFNSKFGLWVSRLDPDYFFFGDAHYGVSRAYIPFTNRSGGNINVTGGMTLHGTSERYGGGKLRGDLGYGSEAYRFYGSSSPGVLRTVSRFGLGATLDSPRELLFSYGARAGLLVTNIGDSASSVSETQFHFGGESNLLVGSFPLDGRIDLSLTSIAGSGSGALPYLEASLMTPKHWFGGFFVQGSVHLYLTQGMLSQKLARVYPHVAVGFRVLENSVASASYLGKVQFNTLSALVDSHPYLSAASTIRQSDLPLDLILALETDWNEVWRTRFSARFRTVREYPLFTEGGGGFLVAPLGAPEPKGIWVTGYLGTTSIASYEANVFAKFDANSYFTLSLEINSSRNSKTQWDVPYLPDLRIGAGFSLQVLRGLQIFPSVVYVGRRVPDLYVASKLKEHARMGLRAEFSALKALGVFLDFQNATNSRYEEWSGYRAAPLVITAGIGYRW
ncbi:MAG: hypothetical protein HW389_165 [Bacteroidetes bacterium]|nr:hypothetical protein [Bacteroidota bacterium]